MLWPSPLFVDLLLDHYVPFRKDLLLDRHYDEVVLGFSPAQWLSMGAVEPPRRHFEI